MPAPLRAMEDVSGLPALERYPLKNEQAKDEDVAAVGDAKPMDPVLLQHSASSLLSGTDDPSFTFLYDFYGSVPAAPGSSHLLPAFGLSTVGVSTTKPQSPPSPPPLPVTTSSVIVGPTSYPAVASSAAYGDTVIAPSVEGSPHVQTPTGASASSDLVPSQATLFHSYERYHHYLEAPTSVINVRGEDTVTYLNKGQFYSVILEANLDVPVQRAERRVRSDLYLVFREEKDARSELQHWEYWHSQQANPNQRAVDVDRKAFKNISSFEDRAFNTYSFFWDPSETAKVVVRLNCLSTEFSSQKGVKGIPLYLQIDTFEDALSDDPEPVHRCYCKVKVFRDKGAERKNKDESKTADRRMAKILKANQSARKRPSPPQSVQSSSGEAPSSASLFIPPSKVTHLHSTSTLGRKPVQFIPNVASASSLFNNHAQSEMLMALIRDREAKRTFSATLMSASDQLDDLDMGNARKLKAAGPPSARPAVTVYVRKEEEKVYNAIMLDELTVSSLNDLIGRKYGVPAGRIKHTYKRTKRGFLVNMDDRMVEQFVNEDDFIIQLDYNNPQGYFELYLSY